MESENSPGSSDILDLLFDDYGILKTDLMKTNEYESINDKQSMNINDLNIMFDNKTDGLHGVSHVDFSDFDLTDNLFESLINQAEPNSLLEEESSVKHYNSFHTDHTYIAHKSPSQQSDSGISNASDDSHLRTTPNMTDDQLEKIHFQDYQTCDAIMDTSPSSSDSHVFDLMGYDDGAELTDENNTTLNDVYDDELSPGINDDEFSIDFDITDFDFSPSLHNKGTQSILLLDGSSKKIIPLKKTSKDGSLPFTVRDIDPLMTNTTDFPKLRLTDEEKDLLIKEGFTLPSHLPLTREEERVLKAVRRKIRNKISAKESRKRKQTYVDGLEQRVKMCTAENRELQKKVNNLEKQNVSLVSQLKKLQSLMSKSKLSAPASTCVMVLLLSFALFVIPTFDPFGSSSNDNHSPISISSQSVRGKARSLLDIENNEGVSDSDDDPYGVSSRPTAPWTQTAKLMSAAQKGFEGYDASSDEFKIRKADDKVSDRSDLGTGTEFIEQKAVESIQNEAELESDDASNGKDLRFVSENIDKNENVTLNDQKDTDFHSVNINNKQGV